MWYPFRTMIYRFKISHQCIFCRKISQKKKLHLVNLTNHDYIIKGENVLKSYHSKCLKHVLESPEKYDNYILSIASWLPEYLEKEQQKRKEDLEHMKSVREEYIEKAKIVNLSLFIDESTGRISFGEKK